MGPITRYDTRLPYSVN